jgi:PAS domain S-box-containing protein
MITIANIELIDLLDSLNDGVYACDAERRIIYWSKSAERITGWLASEVVGRKCSDNVLAHVDKDNRSLCGEEFCPLHRSMCTDKGSNVSQIVFGLTKSGQRLPMAASVAPLHDSTGCVVGGVETFRDFSEAYGNLLRAKKIQTLAMENSLPVDSRISFNTFYLPNDIIGGDFYSIKQLPSGEYAFMLADVMGHGVAAALYTMHLSTLWERYSSMLAEPREFARIVNHELCKVVKDESFATAICGVINPDTRKIRVASAAWPPLLMFKAAGTTESAELPGWPFGMEKSSEYEESEFQFAAGECLLLFSDGATEIHNSSGELLDLGGFAKILDSLTYPANPIKFAALHEALLSYSNSIRLEDDITLLEIRFT